MGLNDLGAHVTPDHLFVLDEEPNRAAKRSDAPALSSGSAAPHRLMRQCEELLR
jgi:hypothetical protein